MKVVAFGALGLQHQQTNEDTSGLLPSNNTMLSDSGNVNDKQGVCFNNNTNINSSFNNPNQNVSTSTPNLSMPYANVKKQSFDSLAGYIVSSTHTSLTSSDSSQGGTPASTPTLIARFHLWPHPPIKIE
jgi:hypothetical protein